jgi:outer membrane immunogenic protein
MRRRSPAVRPAAWMAILAAGPLLSIPSVPAAAQAVKAPLVSPAPNWTGFYVGGGAGYTGDSFEYHFYANDLKSESSSPYGGRGGFLTVLGGYDLMLTSRLLAGVTIDAEVGGPLSRSDNTVDGDGDFKRNSAWSVGGRFGWLATPATLVYVPVGYTQAQYSWSDKYVLANLKPTLRSDWTQGGYVGAGLETRVGGNWTLRGEYRYTWLDPVCVSKSGALPTCRGADVSPSGLVREEQFAEQSMRVALAYRFNGPGSNLATNSQASLADTALQTKRNWSGFYLGAGGGAVALNNYARAYNSGTNAIKYGFDIGSSGAMGTLEGGYDYQFAPQFVAGVFADVDWSQVKSAQVQVDGAASGSGAFTRDRGWSAGARAGWLAMPDTLLYLPVGFTQSHYAWDGAYFSYTPKDIKTFSTSQNGFFAGFGVETMFGDHWAVRGEYRYAWLDGNVCGGSSAFQTIPTCKGANDSVHDVIRLEDIREQTFRAVVSYKFN